jgi:hypothetical protein
VALKPGNNGAGSGERDPRLDLLYRDAAREAPPAHLDAAILAAARREVGARPRALSALRRWRVPVSIAAVVVLSMSLVTLVKEEEGYGPFLRDAGSPAEAPAARMAESPEQPAESAKAPEARKRAAVSVREESSLRRDEAAPKAEAEPHRSVEREQARSSGAPAAGPDTGAAPPAAVGGVLSYQLQESPARAEADAAQRPAPSVGVRGSAADPAPRAAAPQPKPLADNRRMQAEQALAMKQPPVWQGLEQEPPQKWLERLAELKRQGRTGEASELLAELKRRFPNYPLPSGLE